LPQLRAQRSAGHRHKIWQNLRASADWCLQQQARTEWIPTAADDPQHENLYDRFYAAMHDRKTSQPMSWWHMDNPMLTKQTFRWPDGVELTVEKGRIAQHKADGYTETPVHFGGMKFADPCPRTYATVTIEPDMGTIRLVIRDQDRRRTSH
jgi:hypothetical protein